MGNEQSQNPRASPSNKQLTNPTKPVTQRQSLPAATSDGTGPTNSVHRKSLGNNPSESNETITVHDNSSNTTTNRRESVSSSRRDSVSSSPNKNKRSSKRFSLKIDRAKTESITVSDIDDMLGQELHTYDTNTISIRKNDNSNSTSNSADALVNNTGKASPQPTTATAMMKTNLRASQEQQTLSQNETDIQALQRQLSRRDLDAFYSMLENSLQNVNDSGTNNNSNQANNSNMAVNSPVIDKKRAFLTTRIKGISDREINNN